MVFPFDKLSICSTIDYGYVRFLNAAPGLSKIKVYVNGVDMHKGLGYKEFTEYDKAARGSYRIKIVEHDRQCLDREITIGAEKIYTIAVSGDNDDLRLNVIEDTKREKTGNACVRFINLSCDVARADICMNSIKVISDLCYKECSKYLTTTPKDYTITANMHSVKETLLTVPNARLGSDKYYSVYLVGKLNNLQMLIPLEGSTYLKF